MTVLYFSSTGNCLYVAKRIGGSPIFGSNCISCGACLQNCPQNAIHHRKEKSSARYRNPHISLEELKITS
ncbi:MAG: 4Fe-4S binding protein [Butyrivibrio sp.]|nr:4Fe-4S binding protein [Butyrivibrio sp.]